MKTIAGLVVVFIVGIVIGLVWNGGINLIKLENLHLEANVINRQTIIKNQLLKSAYSDVNLKQSIEAGLENNKSNEEIVETILALKDKPPDQGKDYLKNHGYSRAQVSAIYNNS